MTFGIVGLLLMVAQNAPLAFCENASNNAPATKAR